MSIKKIILALLFMTMIAGASIGYSYYNKIYKGNIIENGFLYIPTNATYEQTIDLIAPFLENGNSF